MYGESGGERMGAVLGIVSGDRGADYYHRGWKCTMCNVWSIST